LPHYAHVAANPRPLGSQVRELILCYFFTFIYPFVVTNKLRYLFQATGCRTPSCSAVSPGGQPTRRDSAEGSHDALPVRLLPPQRASGPLEAGDPHVPLHRRRDDGDPSGHVAADDDAEQETVDRFFEAYLLWLFGFVLFCSSQGDAVASYLIPHARRIADAPLDTMP
jgi:hypothetical protein